MPNYKSNGRNKRAKYGSRGSKKGSSSTKKNSKFSKKSGSKRSGISNADLDRMGIERKYFDLTWNAEPIDNDEANDPNIISPSVAGTTTGTAAGAMNVMREGSGSTNRIGRKVTMDSISLNGTLDFFTTAQSGDWFDSAGVVLAMVVDHQPNGVVPTFSDIYDFNNSNPQGAAPYMYRNMEHIDRFTVLCTDCVNPGFTPVFADGESNQFQIVPNSRPTFSMSWTGSMDVVYKANAGTFADIVTNAVYLVAYNAHHATLPVHFDGKGRIRFRG